MAKTRRAELRLDAEDHDLLRAKARELGISFSDLLIQSARVVTAAEQGDVPELVLVDATTWSQIRRELNRQGVNFNQVAHSFNTCALILDHARQRGVWAREDIATVMRLMGASRQELIGVRAGLSSLASDTSRLVGMAHLCVPTLPPGAPRVDAR